MAKILITGGAGFMGSQVGYYLSKRNHEIFLFDNLSYGHRDNLKIDDKEFGEFLYEDIRTDAIYEYSKGMDYILHFAGIAPLPDCQSNPQEAISVNVGGTANVLNAACHTGVKRVIFASTSAIYENNTVFPSKESDETSPDLIYPISKKQAELLCNAYIKTHKLPVTILRFFNVYGPHQDFKRKHPALTGYIIKQLLKKEQVILHSDGNQKRDYVYIDDVAKMIEICLTHKDAIYNTFNVASGLSYSVNDIYKYMAQSFKSKMQPIYRPAEQLWDKYPSLKMGKYILNQKRLEKEVNKFSLGDINKAQNLLNWEITTSLQLGLDKTVRYALKK